MAGKGGGLSHLYLLLIVLLGWVIFNLTDLGAALGYYRAMFGGGSGLWSEFDLYSLRSYAVTLLLGALAALPLGKRVYRKLPERARNLLTPVLIAAALVLSTAYLVNASYNPFLYFRF